jgi:hypothetical protein
MGLATFRAYLVLLSISKAISSRCLPDRGTLPKSRDADPADAAKATSQPPRTRSESARTKLSAQQLKNGNLFKPKSVDLDNYYSTKIQEREKKPHVPKATDCVKTIDTLRRAISVPRGEVDYEDAVHISTVRPTPVWSDCRKVFECEELHDRLQAKGVKIKKEALQRALLPPALAAKEFRLPQNYSSGLFSCPTTWFRNQE